MHPSVAPGFDWQALIDQIACGIVAYDADDRLVVCNADFRQLYAPLADALVPGRRFEELLRLAIARGLLPEAVGRVEAFVAQRLHEHANPGPPIVRRMADGHWRRITESRLPDGGLLAFSVDVSAEVLQREQAERALAAAQLAGERLEDAIAALPAGFELWDADDRLVAFNAELGRLYPAVAHLLRPGVGWEETVRANHAAGALAVPADELDAYIERRRIERRRDFAPSVHATGDGRWISVVVRPARHGGLVAVRTDVTELRNQRAAAEAATARLHDAIEALPEGFALYDADDRLVVCNQRYRELYRQSAPAMVLGARFEDVLRYGLERGQYPQATGREAEWLAERMERHRNPGAPEIQQLPDNRWLRIDERPTREGGIAGVRTEVTELVRREQELVHLNRQLDAARVQLEQLAETDALTGVANRRLFDRRLAEEWARCARHGTPLALLLIDVDHFKRFNDRYGHPAGDRCLQQVARALAASARRPADLVSRYGGEEFAVLLPQTDGAGSQEQARRMLRAIQELAIPHEDSPPLLRVTVSVGGARADPARQADPSALLRAADEALYVAKAGGRNRAEFR